MRGVMTCCHCSCVPRKTLWGESEHSSGKALFRPLAEAIATSSKYVHRMDHPTCSCLKNKYRKPSSFVISAAVRPGDRQFRNRTHTGHYSTERRTLCLAAWADENIKSNCHVFQYEQVPASLVVKQVPRYQQRVPTRARQWGRLRLDVSLDTGARHAAKQLTKQM